jgi:hypothetical protein
MENNPALGRAAGARAHRVGPATPTPEDPCFKKIKKNLSSVIEKASHQNHAKLV